MTIETEIETVEVAKDSLEALSENIKVLAKVAESMYTSGLKEETIILLLHDHSKVGKTNIKNVLRSLRCLGYYLQ